MEFENFEKVGWAVNHSFNLLKSESTLIQWVCSMCHSGPYWYIFECKYCKLQTRQPCTSKVEGLDVTSFLFIIEQVYDQPQILRDSLVILGQS
jgi:hypothetical protein